MLTSLFSALTDLVNSPYPRSQLEIFHQGQVLLQVFNQNDVKKWDLALPTNQEGGVMVNVFFNKNKRNNGQNYSRFSKSPLFGLFTLHEYQKGRVKSFFMPVSKQKSIRETAFLIQKILLEIYELPNDTPLDIFVRAY